MSGDAAPLHIGRVGLQSAGGTTLLVDWRADEPRPPMIALADVDPTTPDHRAAVAALTGDDLRVAAV
mgnify:CR=1 FL=1